MLYQISYSRLCISARQLNARYRVCVSFNVCVRRFIPSRKQHLLGLVIRFSLRVREVPGSISGAALLNQPQTLAGRVGAYLRAWHCANK